MKREDFIIPPFWAWADSDLEESINIARGSTNRTFAHQAELLGLMRRENDELRLRFAVLIRLLVEQGTISADQLNAALSQARTEAEAARAKMLEARAAKLRPKPAKSPKPGTSNASKAK